MRSMLPQYQFERLLGRGGMGAVYKAVQVSLDRTVAIKVLPGDLIDDTDSNFLERFRNEARTMARMNHPAIVNVYDFGETQTGLLYFVMEFINGTDVAQMIATQGRLPEAYALSITAHVCDALNYAHTHGVIHRDIKPANILINMDGAVKVADFGLAKQSDAGMSGLTRTNMAMGTPDFVAPEALMPGVPLDGRADLYAIGVMLYQMLTGEIPRGMWTMPGIKLGTDPRFDAIIAKAMQSDREERYQCAASLRKDLDTILTTPRALVQQQPAATPPQTQTAQKPVTHGPRAPQGQPLPTTSPPPPPAKKSSIGLILGLGATAVLVVGAYFFFKPPSGAKGGSPPPLASNKPLAPTPPPPPPPVSVKDKKGEDSKPRQKTPVVAQPLPPARSAKQTIDLLAVTDPVKDQVPVPGLVAKNEWKREGAALVYQSDGRGGKIAAPVAFDCPDYEMEMKAVKLSGNDRIHLDLPLKKGRILPLVFNSPNRKVVHERQGDTWGSVSTTVHVVVRVIDKAGAAGRVVIQRKGAGSDEKVIADWSGDLDSLAKAGEAHPRFPGQQVTSVFLMRDRYSIQTWTLRVFEGEARLLNAEPEPAKVAAPVVASVPTAAMTPLAAPPSVPTSAAAPQDAVTAKLTDLESKFQAALERDAGAAYKAQVATLNTGYTAALDRALGAASKAGQLEEAVVLREEKARIGSGKELPPEDLDSLPASLKKLRATWRGTESDYARQRDAKAAPLYAAYDKTLDALQTELTKQNKIDDALRVKSVRDALAQRRGGGAPPLDETPAPSKAPAAMPAGAVAVEASSSWRKAAEWILDVGGEINIRRNGTGFTRVKDVKDLPGGRFDIIAIVIEPRGGKGPQITDDDLTRFNGLRDIESVRMSHLTAVTGGGFAAFAASAESMTQFAVYDSPLQPQHMGLITRFKNLRRLELNSIPSLTAESLAGIQVLKELTQLRLLGQMKVDDKILLGLAGLTKLEDLSLPGAPITDEGLVALRGMKSLLYLDLSACKSITGSGLAHLAGAKELGRLVLGHSAVDDTALAHLSGLTRLRDVGLHQTAITDDGIRHLASLKELRSLEIGAKGITGATLHQLSGCKELIRLDLYERSGPDKTSVDDAGLQSLAAAGLPKLETLSFARGGITAAALAHLKDMKLTKLSTNECPTLEGLHDLASITTLKSLEIERGNLDDEGLAVLAGLKSLETFSSSASKITDAGLKVLQNMPALKNVTLRGSQATKAGLDALAKARPDLKVSL
ncbi:MAG: protein kinase domain-containing protein [Prosthecobacter sp.]